MQPPQKIVVPKWQNHAPVDDYFPHANRPKRTMVQMLHPLALLVFALLPLLMGQKANPAPKSEKLREAVHHLFIQGHPLGEIMRRDEKLPNGQYKHTYVMEMQLQRGPHRLVISSELHSFSGPKLNLLSFELIKKEGELVIKSSGKVEDDTLTLETTRAGHTTSQSIPLPKDTLSSLSYDFYVWQNRDHLKKFDGLIFHEDLGTFTEQSSQIEKKADGYRMVHHALNMETQEQYNLKGQLQSAHTIQMDLWAMVPGQKPPDASQKPLDIMAISSWKAPELPSSLQSVTYEITVPPDVPFTPHTDAFQTITSSTNNIHIVHVSRFTPHAFRLGKKEQQRLRQSTALEPIQHIQIQTLAQKLKKTKPMDTIRAVSQYVFEHITNKSLDRGAASALETLESQTGDCTEHSILASSILRAQGFPTRLVDGLIVADGKMGYHEWIEVYVHGQGFVPVDPTFNEIPAGPNRLKFATGDSSPQGMVQLGVTATQLLSGLQIKVLAHKKMAPPSQKRP